MCEVFFHRNESNGHISLKEFNDVFGDNGGIVNLLKKYNDELKSNPKPIPNLSEFSPSDDKAKGDDAKDIKIKPFKKQDFKKLEQFKESIRKIKISNMNSELIDQCTKYFQEINSKDELDDKESNSIDSYDLNIEITDSLFSFYDELNELKEITKINIDNLADSIKFQSLSKYGKT